MDARQSCAWARGTLLAGSAAIGDAHDPSSASCGGPERTVASSREHLAERLERTVLRLEARLDGHGGDSMMGGREAMMSGGGMVGGRMTGAE